jgi:hypothetical protein
VWKLLLLLLHLQQPACGSPLLQVLAGTQQGLAPIAE